MTTIKMLICFDINRSIKGTAGKLERTPLLLWHFSSKTRNTVTTKQISREKMRETGLGENLEYAFYRRKGYVNKLG